MGLYSWKTGDGQRCFEVRVAEVSRAESHLPRGLGNFCVIVPIRCRGVVGYDRTLCAGVRAGRQVVVASSCLYGPTEDPALAILRLVNACKHRAIAGQAVGAPVAWSSEIMTVRCRAIHAVVKVIVIVESSAALVRKHCSKYSPIRTRAGLRGPAI